MAKSIRRVLSILGRGARDLVVPPPGNVPGLDVLRSLAIILVISGHYFGEFTTSRNVTLNIGRLPFFYSAWTGVDLFFVLSGYLIGRQLWRELSRRNTIDVPTFLLKRGLRIWPYYFAFLAWTYFTSHRPIAAFLPDLTFLSNYMHNSISGGWSLSTEEQFYIFVPLLLLSANKFVRVQFQFLVVGALLLALPLIRLVTLNMHPAGITPDEFRRLIQLPFHTHADGLLAGLLIAWISILKPRFLEPLPIRRNIVLPSILAAAGLLLHSIDSRLFGFSGLALIFGGMTLFVLRDRSPLSRFAKTRCFYVVSRLSYGMYLNQFPVLAFWVPIFVAETASFNPYLSFFLGYPLVILISMAISAVTFIAVESPFLQLRDRWLLATKGRKATSQSGSSVVS